MKKSRLGIFEKTIGLGKRHLAFQLGKHNENIVIVRIACTMGVFVGPIGDKEIKRILGPFRNGLFDLRGPVLVTLVLETSCLTRTGVLGKETNDIAAQCQRFRRKLFHRKRMMHLLASHFNSSFHGVSFS